MVFSARLERRWLNQQGDVERVRDGLPGVVGFACTRLIASLRDIFRRSPVADADEDEGPASATGVRGRGGAFSGSTSFGSVWFVFLLILLLPCKTSGKK